MMNVWGRIAIKIRLHSWLQWYFWWMRWCGGKGGNCHGAEVLLCCHFILFLLCRIWFESGMFFYMKQSTLMYGTIPYGMVLQLISFVPYVVQRTAAIAQITGIWYRLWGKNESENNHTNVVWFSSLFSVEMFLTPKRGLISSKSLFRGARKIIQLLYDA